MRFWIRKAGSKGAAYYSIINDLRLTDKEDFRKKICKKPLAAVPILWFCLIKIKMQVDTVYQKVIYNSCFLLFLRHVIQKTKEHTLHKWGLIVFYSKNNFCTMNEIKLVWFYSLHRNFFLSKNVIFLYILKIFFTVLL